MATRDPPAPGGDARRSTPAAAGRANGQAVNDENSSLRPRASQTAKTGDKTSPHAKGVETVTAPAQAQGMTVTLLEASLAAKIENGCGSELVETILEDWKKKPGFKDNEKKTLDFLVLCCIVDLGEKFSIHELDRVLKIKRKDVYSLARSRKIPSMNIASANFKTLFSLDKYFGYSSIDWGKYLDEAEADSESHLDPGYAKYLEMNPLPAAKALPPTATVEANKTSSAPISAATEKNKTTPAPSTETTEEADSEAEQQKQLLVEKTQAILTEHAFPGAREAHIQDLYDYAPTLLRCNVLSFNKGEMRNTIRHQWAEYTADGQAFKNRMAADDWARRQEQKEGTGVSLKRSASPGNSAERPTKQQFRSPKA